MCNLISHYLILSPGRCSVQSSSLNPRHRFFEEKRCVAAQISTDFPLYVSRYTLFPHFPCVACRVNSLSLRTIYLHSSTYIVLMPIICTINHCTEHPTAEIYVVRQHKSLKSVHLIERYTCLHLCSKESCTRFQANEHMNVHYIA